MTLHQVNEATSIVYKAAGEEANIIFGAVVDQNLGDEMRVTVIATGFGSVRSEYARPAMLTEVDLFRPVRRAAAAKPEAANGHEKAEPVRVEVGPKIDVAELEVPTFLRRKLDR